MGLAGLGVIAIPALAPPASAASRLAGEVQRLAREPVPALPASARFVGRPQVAPTIAGVRQACATPTRPGQMACMALVRTSHSAGADASSPSGYSPANLLSAYGLATAAAKPGDGETVAVVDAYNDPHASSDLAVYRKQFKLPSCTTASKCLKITNEFGGSALPQADPTGGGWELEESLDLDMVSAICPNCSIVLVEANTDNISDLARAEATASRTPHVNAVDNSWGSGAEFIGETEFDPDFYAPGVAITAAGGDSGYGAQYPAASPYVTAVGGTRLVSSGGKWSQAAWGMVGSGCSALEPKPSWQTADDRSPDGCLNRTDNDVSADADPSTGVALYDSEPFASDGGTPGWTVAGGTSVSTPVIAATYALADIAAGGPGKGLAAGTMPASYPYLATAGLTRVVGGSNGRCESDRKYLCTAVKGFNGPTGLGTPDGTAAFTDPGHSGPTILDPGPQVVQPGASIDLTLHTLPATQDPAFAMAPPGLGDLSVDSSGTLRGTAPTKAGVYHVKVTATVSGAGTASTSFSIVVLPGLPRVRPGTGEIRLGGGSHCLTDAGNSARAGTAARIEGCTGQADQQWQFVPRGQFGGSGLIKIHGRCLSIATGSGNGAKATIARCSSSSREQWAYLSGDGVRNSALGRCLAVHGRVAAGVQAVAWTCGRSTDWALPAAPVFSGVAGLCLADPRTSSAAGTPAEAARCGSNSAQRWTANRNGTLEIAGRCLAVRGASMLSGAAVVLARCTGVPSQLWQRGPGDELMNANSSRCLADPNDSSRSGTRLIQDDCYSLTGEDWMIS
jgi:Ricin-type beta-trefoil lectin domain/Putative Ig domain